EENLAAKKDKEFWVRRAVTKKALAAITLVALVANVVTSVVGLCDKVDAIFTKASFFRQGCDWSASDASNIERTASDASNIERTASDASTVPMLSRRGSFDTEQHEERASSDPDVAHVLLVLRMYSLQLHPHSGASASSAHDDHAHQHPATHHRDPASPGTTSASADDFVWMPSNIGVRRMFDLMNASCDPSSPQGAWSNLQENVVARNILRTESAVFELAGCRAC
ncbi:hypothetical protein T484DRAFT_1786168, partial [Baffinella frigidus]